MRPFDDAFRLYPLFLGDYDFGLGETTEDLIAQAEHEIALYDSGEESSIKTNRMRQITDEWISYANGNKWGGN